MTTVADLGFFRGGGANSPGGGAPTYDFAKFSQKLHEIERIWAPRGEGLASKILLYRSATGPPQNDWPKFSVECKVPIPEFCACHYQGEIFWSRFVRDARVLGGPSNVRITISYVPFKKAMHWGAGSHKV